MVLNVMQVCAVCSYLGKKEQVLCNNEITKPLIPVQRETEIINISNLALKKQFIDLAHFKAAYLIQKYI